MFFLGLPYSMSSTKFGTSAPQIVFVCFSEGDDLDSEVIQRFRFTERNRESKNIQTARASVATNTSTIGEYYYWVLYFFCTSGCEVEPVWCNNIILFDSFFFPGIHFDPYFSCLFVCKRSGARIHVLAIVSRCYASSYFYILYLVLEWRKMGSFGRHTLVELWLLSVVDVLREEIPANRWMCHFVSIHTRPMCVTYEPVKIVM